MIVRLDESKQQMKLTSTWRWGIAFCLAWASSLAGAQTYPAKPIKVIVGYAAGGAVDIVARTVGQSLSNSMGQAGWLHLDDGGQRAGRQHVLVQTGAV